MRVRLLDERLRELLAREPISQNHWAMRLGLSSGHLADLSNGRHRFPGPATFEAVLHDRYVLDHGGMGTVYLGREVRHGRPVAIKMLLPDLPARRVARTDPATVLRE